MWLKNDYTYHNLNESTVSSVYIKEYGDYFYIIVDLTEIHVNGDFGVDIGSTNGEIDIIRFDNREDAIKYIRSVIQLIKQDLIVDDIFSAIKKEVVSYERC